MDNSIDFGSIYPLDNTIQALNNWGMFFYCSFVGQEMRRPLSYLFFDWLFVIALVAFGDSF